MSRKRKPAARKRPQKPGRTPSSPADLGELPDRRSMDTMWRQFHGEADPSSPRGKGEALIDQAFREKDKRRRTELAQQALAAWPDCADAYVLLAEHAPSRREALELYRQGLAAGERALGPTCFQEHAGYFWGLLETRPYMRARLGLALTLWTTGEREETVRHLQEMLRLNPNDNQGVRYTLVNLLSQLDRDGDLASLIGQYPDDSSAWWAYSKALLAFRSQGDTPAARQLLEDAKRGNPHVLPYLMDRKQPPLELPPHYSPGKESEAIHYVAAALPGWKGTPGAVQWLRAVGVEGEKKTKPAAPQGRGPMTAVKNWLNKRLPQRRDEWQADCRQLNSFIRVGEEKLRPWLILVTNKTDDLVLASGFETEEPSAAKVWDTLVQAMQSPAAGEPHRPARLQVRRHPRWQNLRLHVEEVGINLEEVDELDQLNAVFGGLSEHLTGKEPPGLLDVPGVGPEQVGQFYEAAADFYRHAPWKKLGYEAAIEIACAGYQSGPWYGVVMGQSGLVMGVALYEDLNALRRMWREGGDNDDNARRSVATTLWFAAEDEVPPADSEAVRRFGWKVAGPDAYPHVFRKEPGLSTRPPLAWELELMEGCLRAIPEFMGRRKQSDSAKETVTVPTAGGTRTFQMAWVPNG